MSYDEVTATLSCYTANLAAYLEKCQAGAVGRIARSVRLAVRTTPRWPLAFSHHRVPLNDLSDGTRLGFRGAASYEEARAAIGTELEQQRQVLVVGRSDRLPWSASRTAAPHLVLLTGFSRNTWHVVDRFSGLFSDGETQRPFTGALSDDEFEAMLAPVFAARTEHLLRNRYAFGHATSLPPAGTYQWLVREEAHQRRDGLDEISAMTWCTNTADSLDHLGTLLTQTPQTLRTPRFAEDLWAAAQHHELRCHHLQSADTARSPLSALLSDAVPQWQRVPQVLQIAINSAIRGRPRPALVRNTFERLARTERDIAALLAVSEDSPEHTVGPEVHYV
jgi:hypothetical protein